MTMQNVDDRVMQLLVARITTGVRPAEITNSEIEVFFNLIETLDRVARERLKILADAHDAELAKRSKIAAAADKAIAADKQARTDSQGRVRLREADALRSFQGDDSP